MNNLPAEGFKQGALTNSTWSVLSWADAAPAPNAIITAIINATVTNNRMRLISATSFCVPGNPLVGCSVKENYGALLQGAHRQNYLIGVPNFLEGVPR